MRRRRTNAHETIIEPPTPPPLEEICRRIVARRADLARLGATFVGVFG